MWLLIVGMALRIIGEFNKELPERITGSKNVTDASLTVSNITQHISSVYA